MLSTGRPMCSALPAARRLASCLGFTRAWRRRLVALMGAARLIAKSSLGNSRGVASRHMLARLVVLAVVVLGSSEAHAQLLANRGPPQFRLVHRNALAVRINPLGLLYDGKLMGRLRLYESQGTALRDNFVSVGASLGASPAFFRA